MDSTMVAVTPEARKAAADLLDEVSSLLGDTGIGQVADLIRDGEYDEHDATLAFARFERDILARSRSEVGCTIPADHPLAKGLRTSQKALDQIKRQEQANIAGYLAMRDVPIGSVAAETRIQSEGRTGAGEALPFYVKLVEQALQDYVDGSSDKTLTETAQSIIASISNPCAKIFDHKWLDPECVETGCQSLVWKSRYEAAVKGRQEFRQALRDERAAALFQSTAGEDA